MPCPALAAKRASHAETATRRDEASRDETRHGALRAQSRLARLEQNLARIATFCERTSCLLVLVLVERETNAPASS